MACLLATIFRLIYYSGTIGALSLSTVLAAEHDPVEQLDPIVITATASPTTLSQAPAAVTISSRVQIAQEYAHRLSTVLQQIPRVFVDEIGGGGGLSSVYLRGGDPNLP